MRKVQRKFASFDKKSPVQIFYAVLIGFAVISFWRGIWGLWSIYVFPNNLELSLWISVFTGFFILLFTHKIISELS